MTLRHFRLAASLVPIALMLLQPLPTSAQTVDLGLVYATGMGLPTLDIRDIAVNLIRTALGFAGFIMVLRVLQGGLMMMTHGGNEDGRAEAIETIKGSVIGIIIIGASSSIVRFVVTAVIDAAGNHL